MDPREKMYFQENCSIPCKLKNINNIIFQSYSFTPQLQLYIYKKQNQVSIGCPKKGIKNKICFIFYISFKSTDTCVFGIFKMWSANYVTSKSCWNQNMNSDLNNPKVRKNTFILYRHQCLH